MIPLSGHHWRALVLVFAAPLLGTTALTVRAAEPTSAEDLFALDLDALRDIQVITAGRRLQTQDDAPGSLTVFSRDEINALGVRTLDELLNYVPGMRSYTFVGPDTSGKAVIETRGVYEPYGHMILLLLDGQRLSAAYNGNFTGANRWISLSSIERVEIIRGPGSALYGGNAMMAVINLISASDEPRQQALLEAGDFGHSRVGVQTGVGNSNDAHWRAWLEWQQDSGDDYPAAFDRYGSSDGTEDPHRGHDIQLSGGNAEWELQLRQHWRRSEDFYLLGRMANGINSSETEQNNARLAWRTQRNAHELTLSAAWLQARWDGLTMLSPQGVPPFLPAPFVGGPALEHEEWQFAADAIWTVDADNIINYGLAYEQATIPRSGAWGNYDTQSFVFLGDVVLQTDEAHRLVIDQDRELRGGYLQWEHRLSADLKTVLGARYDDYEPGEQALTPRFTINWRANEAHQFEAQYAEAYRPPSQVDQFIRETPVVAASPPLKAMASETVELSWLYRDAAWESQLTLFDLNIDDIIGRLPLPDGRVQASNSGRLHTQGLEWSYRRQVQSDWLLRLNASHVLHRETVGAPPDFALSEDYASDTLVSFSSHWNSDPLRIDVMANWASAVAALPNSDDYLQWHLQVRWPLAPEWELYAGLRNGGDQQVLGAEPGSGLGTDSDGNIVRELPQRGQQWLVGVRWSFQGE